MSVTHYSVLPHSCNKQQSWMCICIVSGCCWWPSFTSQCEVFCLIIMYPLATFIKAKRQLLNTSHVFFYTAPSAGIIKPVTVKPFEVGTWCVGAISKHSYTYTFLFVYKIIYNHIHPQYFSFPWQQLTYFSELLTSPVTPSSVLSLLNNKLLLLN